MSQLLIVEAIDGSQRILRQHGIYIMTNTTTDKQAGTPTKERKGKTREEIRKELRELGEKITPEMIEAARHTKH